MMAPEKFVLQQTKAIAINRPCTDDDDELLVREVISDCPVQAIEAIEDDTLLFLGEEDLQYLLNISLTPKIAVDGRLDYPIWCPQYDRDDEIARDDSTGEEI